MSIMSKHMWWKQWIRCYYCFIHLISYYPRIIPSLLTKKEGFPSFFDANGTSCSIINPQGGFYETIPNLFI